MFLKFGSEENIKELYEKGTIFMNSREFFRKIEDKELRGDSYEAAREIINYGPGSFIIPSINHTVRYENIHIPSYFSEVWGNIYSLFCISPETTPEMFDFKMDERVMNFGTHCLVIKDIERFIQSMENKFEFLNYKYFWGIVKYYDKTKINGKISVFEKPKEFCYQKEFRFYIEREGIDPIVFYIEDLKEYSEIMKTKEIMDLKLVPLSEGE